MSFDPDIKPFRPLLDIHWPRFLFDIDPRNLWANEYNPYDTPKFRTAREDILHSYVNLFVEGCVSMSYILGHLLAVLFPFLLLTLIGRLFT